MGAGGMSVGCQDAGVGGWDMSVGCQGGVGKGRGKCL